MQMAKRAIKACLRKLGYKIIRLAQEQELLDKCAGLIKVTEDMYRSFLFKEYPSYDAERIALISGLIGTGIPEAVFIVNYLHRAISRADGDVCEFGVAQGRTSALLAYEIRQDKRGLWLFDSFSGLPKPSQKDELIDDIFGLGAIEKYEGTMSCKAGMVMDELKKLDFPLSRVNIVAGFIEKTLQYTKLPEKVCFAYVDLDFYGPTVEALNFLDKTLQNNGYIVVDDYGFFCSGVKTAVDEFIALRKGQYGLTLPPSSCEKKFCIIERIRPGKNKLSF